MSTFSNEDWRASAEASHSPQRNVRNYLMPINDSPQTPIKADRSIHFVVLNNYFGTNKAILVSIKLDFVSFVNEDIGMHIITFFYVQ